MYDAPNIGVYFSANDAVYDWTVAFLNSFRTFNPELRLLLIPFNGKSKRIVELSEKYNFTLYEDKSFGRLEAIGQAFELGHTQIGPYWFRRYAAFWGPLERFMYLDARQVVLADLQPLIGVLDDYQFDFLHYDCAINQVYEQGPFRRSLLRRGQGRGFLSGLWASRKGLFSIEEFEKLANEALAIREQLNPRNTDQAFINYCCDMKPVRYGHFAEVLGGICQNAWARQSGYIYSEGGKYYLWDYGGQDHKKQVVLLHWAGNRMNSMMPHQHLFIHFYSQHQPLQKRVQLYLRQKIDYILRRPFEFIRRGRIVNTFYHTIRSAGMTILQKGNK